MSIRKRKLLGRKRFVRKDERIKLRRGWAKKQNWKKIACTSHGSGATKHGVACMESNVG